MKHNKSNTAFLHEIVIIFSPIYLSGATYVISSFNLITVLQELFHMQYGICKSYSICNNYFMNLWSTLEKNNTPSIHQPGGLSK